MRRMRSTVFIARMFYEADSGTIIRKPNMRRFAEDNDVFYHILPNSRWLIDIDEFIKKVNPKNIDTRLEQPRLRCIQNSVKEFNNTYPQYRIDNHTVERCMKSDKVSKHNHGNRWLINYDELEKVILEYLRQKNKYV